MIHMREKENEPIKDSMTKKSRGRTALQRREETGLSWDGKLKEVLKSKLNFSPRDEILY